MSQPLALEDDIAGESCTLSVRAQPGARKSGVAGLWNGMLKLRVTAPPEDGRANDELVQLLARLLGVKRAAVQLIGGATTRQKRFRIELPLSVARERIDALVAPGTTEDSTS